MKILKKAERIQNNIIDASEKTITASYTTHQHNFFEMEFIIDGSGSYVINGDSYPIAPNMLFFMTPADFHSIETTNTHLINIMFPCEMNEDDILYSLMTQRSQPVFRLNGEDALLIRLLENEVVRATTEKKFADALQYLGSIIRKLAGLVGKPADHALPYIRKAILYILENYTDDISLDSVASHVGISGTYFSELFAKEMGVPYKKYLDELRFDFARKLLRFTDEPVAAVLDKSGFTDYANFARRFKMRFGISPTEYRASNITTTDVTDQAKKLLEKYYG